QRERVRADPVRAGLDDGERDRGGDRRVDRVAALQQHAQAGLGGQRLTGRDDAPRRHQRKTARGVRVVLEGEAFGGILHHGEAYQTSPAPIPLSWWEREGLPPGQPRDDLRERL